MTKSDPKIKVVRFIVSCMACLIRTSSAFYLLQRAIIIQPSLSLTKKSLPFMPPKKFSTNKEEHSQCEYKIENEGRYTRYVKPYFQDFRTHAKGRWLGREVLEVFCREFGAHPPSYWVNALRNGQVRINNRIVAADYRFKNSDALLHRAHRHEPPVFGEILLVGETDEIVAISKPPSLPMHPCGAYRHNSLEYIMKREALVPDQPTLLVVHRLDRVTSGLVILAKSKAAAGQISQEIRDKATTKVYLARVKGRFPEHGGQVPHLRELGQINLEEFADETEDYENNGFQDSSAQKKRPLSVSTGTASSSNESAAESEAPSMSPANVGDAAAATAATSTTFAPKYVKKQRSEKKNQFGRGDDIEVEDLPPLLRTVLSAEEVGRAPNVGVLFSPPVSEALENANTKRSAVITSCKTDPAIKKETEVKTEGACSPAEHATPSSKEIWVKCPLGVVSQRDGVHACDPTGKPSLSIFRSLGYDAASDTSLVECRPYTGRTHQLRLHLQLLGTPIANDPCYGGVLFYGDDDRRAQAVAAVKEMRANGIIPLSKVPHFGDPEVDNLLLTVKPDSSPSTITASQEKEGEDESISCALPAENEVVTAPLPGESEDDYLIRTCRYCQDNSSVELEHLLHCDGIWLHALRYTGPPLKPTRQVVKEDLKDTEVADGSVKASADPADFSLPDGRVPRRWAFQAPHPAWAAPFLSSASK